MLTDLVRDAPDPPADLLGIVLGEFIVHGRDVAQALGQRWDIHTEDAAEVLTSLLPIMPAWVDQDGTRGLTATFEVRVRGHGTTWWHVTDGAPAIETARPATGVDVTLSADPVAFLLVSYRRLPWGKPILAGRLRAWGRRGRLPFGMNSYLRAP